MADYRSAFHAGLEAYSDVERARREIDEVFQELARGVQDVSDGHVAIHRREKNSVIGVMRALQKTIAPWITQFEESLVLVATGRNEQDFEVLCAYWLGERGYPVNIIYGRRNVACHDRESLEKGLQDLLEHPDTGGKLGRLMSGDRTSASGAAPPQQ